METARIQNKIKLLFEQISQPNYVMNTYYADSFINKISNSLDPDAANLIGMPLLPNLLIEALKDTSSYHNTVNVFLVRLLAIVSRKEPHFCKILEKRRDKLLEFHNNITEKKMNPSLKVAYLEVALSLAAHRSGVAWLLETDVWKKILSLYDKNTTVFVLRLMYKFSAEFVWKLNDLDDEVNLNAVIKFILQPMLGLNFSNVLTLTTEEEQTYCNHFEPVLQMLLCIVSQDERIYSDDKVSALLLKDYSVVSHLYVFVDRIRKQDTMLLAHKNLLYLVFKKMFLMKPYTPDTVYTQEDFMDILVLYFNAMHSFIQRRNAIMVLDYCGNCNVICRQVCGRLRLATAQCHGRNVEMLNQMMLIYLVPILVYVNSSSTGTATNEYLYQHVSDFINMACEHTARAAYALRDLILELDTSSITLQSVKRLTCFKDHLNNEQANFVFRSLFFALTRYDPTAMCDESEETPEAQVMYNPEETEQEVLVMTYIMDTVCALVKNYDVNWHESLEVICLNSVIHNILTKRQNLTCKFVVSGLNLLMVTVAKFLPPNLSLLMEAKPGSAMHEIGDLIYTKMHDMHWEIRDSALELLHVCTDISFIKFPPIQKQIIDKNLITVAITMAVNDHEPYVQVSALKCIAAACKIAPIWEQIKNEHPNVLERLIGILRQNQEGIVRKEACHVLCEVYQHVKLSPAFKQVLYDHMASAAMCDFHWEVQMNALRFWKNVIQSFLTDQGMLDGTFPPVTFSRETRKIVTLNETEVRKILLRLLDELASIGCLTVLLVLLHDEVEVEVMDAAFAVANELHSILVKYDVPEFIKPIEGDPKTMAELISCVSYECETSTNGIEVDAESSTRSDNVIDGILKSDDMNLLANIYQKGMNLENEAEPAVIPSKLKLVKTASPYLFVSFLKNTDCQKNIKHKREWKNGIRSISSLLDDVLGLYEETGEVNSLDCY